MSDQQIPAPTESHRPGAPLPSAKAAQPSTTPESAEDAAETPAAAVTSVAAESCIEAKRLGERIKFLRQRKAMGLVELGRYTGLSASFLSQLETGRVVPTLRNLARIAMVFSRDLSYFFEPEQPELFRIVRAADRQRLPQTGAGEPGYFYESLGIVPTAAALSSTVPGPRIAPYVAEFLPTTAGRTPRSHSHEGAEFLYVLSGTLKLTHDNREDTFDSGDAVYFAASVAHSYEPVGDATCTALIITLPEPARGNHTGARIQAARAKLAAKKQ